MNGILDTIGFTIGSLRTYLFGRGVLSLAVIAAGLIGSALGAGVTLPALVVAAGGAALSIVTRFARQADYETEMVNLYRDEIAEKLGVAPKEVTREHLKQAAQDNEVIAQALERQRSRNRVGFFTTALAAFATFGMLDFFSASEAVTGFFHETFGDTMGKILSVTSTGIVAGITSIIVKDGLEMAIGVRTGLARAGAHDQIVALDKRLSRGLAISKEQVYAVLVAGSEPLQKYIQKRFNEPYNHMHKSEQELVLQQLGITQQMETLAQQLNTREISPGKLSTLVSDVIGPSREITRSTASHVRGPAHAQTVEADATPATSFVDKLGLSERAPSQSHAERVQAERTNPEAVRSH